MLVLVLVRVAACPDSYLRFSLLYAFRRPRWDNADFSLIKSFLVAAVAVSKVASSRERSNESGCACRNNSSHGYAAKGAASHNAARNSGSKACKCACNRVDFVLIDQGV
ncbi:hypothetical protein [Parendozoicomonas sp. Alg238-R29]|uniref:hypothetical protein n=1 Tax=Parendozoicomonas sp. Alg238-R29 TaxID=2993446 RepID=UPI00248F0EB5|nr:hypothetical protein [Parendozoicomonas sp. Alg238-R29]